MGPDIAWYREGGDCTAGYPPAVQFRMADDLKPPGFRVQTNGWTIREIEELAEIRQFDQVLLTYHDRGRSGPSGQTIIGMVVDGSIRIGENHVWEVFQVPGHRHPYPARRFESNDRDLGPCFRGVSVPLRYPLIIPESFV
jgi:hypothetical protein